MEVFNPLRSGIQDYYPQFCGSRQLTEIDRLSPPLQADTGDGIAGCDHAGVDLTQARTRTTVSVCSGGVGSAERQERAKKQGFACWRPDTGAGGGIIRFVSCS